MSTGTRQSASTASLEGRLGDEHGQGLFDQLTDVQFWIKDAQGRYVRVNAALLMNYGFNDTGAVLGKTDRELFAPHLADRYLLDDRAVLAGRPIHGRIELVARPDHSTGWHVTDKIPLRSRAGRIIATAGITRDLHGHSAAAIGDRIGALAPVVELVRATYAEPLDKPLLARSIGRSIRSLERQFTAAFGMPLLGYQRMLRMHQACHWLVTTRRPITGIALDLGYGDHSHFTREFGRLFGVSPRVYRARWAHRADATPASASLPRPVAPR
ncbi:MAG: AraC family transcriptional regulator [Planctomycetes bacterium]|nr:AraC family transcriptional regulator [Planctomycetota bacterium]